MTARLRLVMELVIREGDFTTIHHFAPILPPLGSTTMISLRDSKTGKKIMLRGRREIIRYLTRLCKKEAA